MIERLTALRDRLADTDLDSDDLADEMLHAYEELNDILAAQP